MFVGRTFQIELVDIGVILFFSEHHFSLTSDIEFVPHIETDLEATVIVKFDILAYARQL